MQLVRGLLGGLLHGELHLRVQHLHQGAEGEAQEPIDVVADALEQLAGLRLEGLRLLSLHQVIRLVDELLRILFQQRELLVLREQQRQDQFAQEPCIGYKCL